MKSGLLTTIFAVTALSLTVARAELEHTYNFLDFGYERTTFEGPADAILDNGHGFAVDLAVSPVNNLLFAGEFHFSRPHERSTDEGVNTFDLQFGAGGYLPINDSISLYAHVGPRFIKSETDDFASPSDWGIYAQPGVRINFTGNFEVYGAYEYASNFDNIHTGIVGAVLHFSETLGVEVFGRFSEDWAYNYGVGVRISR